MAKQEKSGSNGIDPKIAQQFNKDILRQHEVLASLRGEYMKKCRDVREIISDIMDRAKDAGIPKKEFKAFLKQQELRAKAEAVIEKLEEDEQEIFEMIREAIGGLADTPLGQAALNRAEAKAAKKAKDSSVVDGLTH